MLIHPRLKQPTLFLALAFVATVLFSNVFSSAVSVWAQPKIDWSALNLTAEQQTLIEQLETQWKGTYQKIKPQVEGDKKQLRTLLNTPTPAAAEAKTSADSEKQVMLIQSRIQKNEEYLRNEATRIFMGKKKQLTPAQQEQLTKMMNP